MKQKKVEPKILIIGASGFVGSNLLKKFESLGIPVRVMSRTPSKISTTCDHTFITEGDLDHVDTLKDSLIGIETVYYLSHAMGYAADDFELKEKQQALNLTSIASKNIQVIYLSGIIPSTELSIHLRSREKVGEVLRAHFNSVIEFRASIIIGVGSTSFEMVRALVQRLPFILSAKWSNSYCQPIDIKSVVEYLFKSTQKDFKESLVFNIGGKDIFKYKDLLVEYAKFMNLKRPEIKVDQFPRSLAGQLLGVIVPEYSEVGERLIESIEHETILTDSHAKKEFKIKPLTIEEMFQQSKDESLGDMNYDHFFNFLKTNKDLPRFLKGQTASYFIDVPAKLDFEGLMQKLNRIPFINIEEDQVLGFVLSIPLAGELSLKLNPSKDKIIVLIQAKYFFQKTGLTFLDLISKKISSFKG